MACELEELVAMVADGNPGALMFCVDLRNYPVILDHLRKTGLVGSELYRVVNDDYGMDVVAFVEDQYASIRLAEMGMSERNCRRRSETRPRKQPGITGAVGAAPSQTHRLKELITWHKKTQ